MQYNAVRMVGALGSGAGEIPWGDSNPPNVREAGGPRVSTYYIRSQCFALSGVLSPEFRIAEGGEGDPRQLTQPFELPIRFACRVQMLETLGPSDCPLQLFPVGFLSVILTDSFLLILSMPAMVRTGLALLQSASAVTPGSCTRHVRVHDSRQGRTYIHRYISSDCRAKCDHGTILYVRAAKVLIECSTA